MKTSLHGRRTAVSSPAPGAALPALLAGAVAIAVPVLLPLQARAAEATAERSWDIPAGPLDAALSAFAVSAGINLAFDPAQTAGRSSPGVSGKLSADEALSRLLAGTGLRAERGSTGVYRLQTLPPTAEGVTLMRAVQVEGREDNIATTEGTGSYAARSVGTATKLALSPRETPQSITVITRQLIEDKGLTTMEQVLNQTPGITMIGDSSMGSQVSVRGYTMSTGIQIDGMNTTSASSGSTTGIGQHMDPAIADRVEVIKGATGIVSGQGSPAATVNMIRKRPTDTLQISGEVTAASWDRYGAMIDVGGPVTDSGKLRARAVLAERIGNSFIDRVGYERSVAYGVVDWDITQRTMLSLAAEHHRSNNDGIYGYDANPAFHSDGTRFDGGRSFTTAQDWSEGDIRDTVLSASAEHRFENEWFAKLAYRYSHANVDRTQFAPGSYVDRDTGAVVKPYWTTVTRATYSDRYSDSHSIDAYATGPFKLFGRRHEVVFGYNGGSNDYENTSYNSGDMGTYYINTSVDKPAIPTATPSSSSLYKLDQSGVFTTFRFSLNDPLKLMVGGRLSTWEYSTLNQINDGKTGDKKGDIFTPYVGLTYDINDKISLYASHTSIFEPTVAYDASGKLVDPAEGTNNEAGIKLELFDKLNASLGIYETRLDNVAQYGGQLENGDAFYITVDGVKTRGYEFEISGEIAKGWEALIGYDHIKAQNADGTRKLSYVPNDSLKISTSYRLPGSLDALTVGGGLRWQSKTFYETAIYATASTVPAEQQQKSYALLDLFTTYRFTKNVSATLNLNNVFDESYYRSMWGYADYGDPRNVMLTLRAKW